MRQTGMLPNAYITGTLLLYAYDSVEHKSHVRLEGLLGVAVIVAIQNAIFAPFAGRYESSILHRGFVDMEGVIPNGSVTSFMIMAFYLFDIICALAYLILLPMMNIEKKMPKINAELTERKKQITLARGEEWVCSEELERRENEAAEAQKEADRIADLKELCQKKRLDFEVENTKYLKSIAAKKARAEAQKAQM
jgi:hypothetical protein